MTTLIPIVLLSGLLNSDPVVEWNFSVQPDSLNAFTIELEAKTQQGWHIYATELENDLGPIPTSIRFEASDSYALDGGVVEPKAVEVYDPNFEMNVRYHEGSPTFFQRITPRTDGQFVVKGEVEFMVCNDKTCLPPEVVTFSLDVPNSPRKP